MGIPLEESARRAGAHQWAESRLFEVLGGWVTSTPEPDVRVMLDRHSRHAAWRAAQWWDRLPVLADVDRFSLCAPPSPATGRSVAHLVGAAGTVARLAGAYRVFLPRIWVAYEDHRRAVTAVADGSSRRALGIVGPDLAADWQEGEAALQGMLRTPDDVAGAAATVAELEALLLSGD